MPDVLKFAPQDMSRQHGQAGVFAFQSLHAGQLIHADRAFSLFSSLGCLGVDLTPFNDLLFPRRVFFLA